MANNPPTLFQDEWPTKLLGDVMDCLDSRRIPLKESDRANRRGIVPYYGASGIIDWIDEHIYDEPILLISEDGANLESRSLPIAFSVDGKCWVNNHAHVLRVREGSRFFFQCYLNNTDLKDYLSGTTRPKLTQAFLIQIPLPFPPAAEQQAIAHVLRTVQRTKEATEKVIAAARQLKQSLMRHLFTYGPVPVEQADQVPLKETDYGAVPETWKTVPLSECAVVQTGVAKGRKLNGAEAISVPYLRVANVQDGYLDLSEIKTIEIRRSELSRFSLEAGDVVLTEGGDFDKLGRGFIWNGEVPGCVHQNHIFAVRANREMLIPEFLAYLTQSDYGKAYFLSVAHKTTNLACINTTKLKAFPALVPPKEDQREIIASMQGVDQKIAVEEKKWNALDTLFRTLLNRLMTGKVRIQ